MTRPLWIEVRFNVLRHEYIRVVVILVGSQIGCLSQVCVCVCVCDAYPSCTDGQAVVEYEVIN